MRDLRVLGKREIAAKDDSQVWSRPNASRPEPTSAENKDSKTIFFSLLGYVGERPWWPIQCLNKGRKKKAKG